jgi:nitrogen fixation NifU-like protein
MDGFLMTEDMYRQVIMDHYKYPNNKVDTTPGDDYIMMEGINPSCGDQVTIYAKFEADKLVDIKFSGSGCSICCASTSMMTDELKDLSKDQVSLKVEAFKAMVKDKKEPQNFMDAQSLQGVFAFPARFKCAFLGWETVDKIIKGE